MGMTESGWQAIGRIAKARRERLGLRQDELAQYGGPGVATVGKFERAAQDSFPLRTQHQMENALGWSRTIIEQVVGSIDEGTLTVADWEHDLVEESVPDLSHPAMSPANDDRLTAAIAGFSTVIELVPATRREEAMRAVLRTIAIYLDDDAPIASVHPIGDTALTHDEAAYAQESDDEPGEE